MEFGNRDYDLADARFEQERASRVAAIQARLAGDGEATCRGCDRPIPAARRRAIPNAVRCAFCQSIKERGK